MLQTSRFCIAAALLVAGAGGVLGQNTGARGLVGDPAPSSFNWKTWEIKLVEDPFEMKYSRKGLQLQTHDGRYTSRIRWRLQPRWFNFDSDPRRESQFGTTPDENAVMRRARFKVDGKLWGDTVSYNFEHDLLGNNVLNLFADVKVREWLQFRGGQWKSVFSSERAISSSAQQFVERSIVNREFTIDRQVGASIHGHLMPETLGDANYTFEILGGSGRWGGWNDGSPLLVARYQWNFFGREVEDVGGDMDLLQEPAAFIAINGAKNTSRFTRFSSSGGGQLDGFAAGSPDQYDLTQLNGEFFLKYRGFSIQNENHWKNVSDNVNGTSRDLRGTYAQAGYFPHAAWEAFPAGIELGYRWAQVDPNTAVASDVRRENTMVVNLFLEGHTDKFTFDFGRLSLERPGQSSVSDWRYRLQYDVHF